MTMFKNKPIIRAADTQSQPIRDAAERIIQRTRRSSRRATPMIPALSDIEINDTPKAGIIRKIEKTIAPPRGTRIR